MGAVWKTGLPGQKEDIYGAPMRFMHWGRNSLEVLCFSPCESPLFFLLLDIRHLQRRGKNTFFHFMFRGKLHEFDGFHWHLFWRLQFSKSFRECVVKAGDVSFCLVWGGEPSVWWSPHRPRRGGNYSFVLKKDSTNVNMLVLPEQASFCFFFHRMSPPLALS